ncbi:MAG: YceI family protein [Gammaproteobacteria bacterium]|nr:YceI family protein [Gammaproteobacteria bacterium]MDP2141830.1 YceI family protein [Gammaproteobacteria bacterium]MDP2348321.1 YceI family protein [Gammaproteobacteria bacterium]
MFKKILSKYRWLALALVSSVTLVSCDRLLTPGFETSVSELRGGGYVLDKTHAALLFKINHLGFSSFIGRFTDFDASLNFDPENIQNSSLEVIVDTSSINVNLPDFEEELRGSSWFNVASYPQAIYRTTSFVEAIDEDTFVFAGDLTLLGTTAPVNITVNFNGGGRNFLTRRYTLGFSANMEFKRSAFGLDNMVSFGVGDDIALEIHVEFQDAQ